jgi:hypothetical protein
VEIGGGLIKSSTNATATNAGPTTRGINSNVDGIDYGSTSAYGNYPVITARYSQILYNTDIVLMAPEGKTRESRILDATLPTDGTVYGNSDTYSTANNKRFSPTVKILGGSIYVGAGQTLTIDGGRLNTTGDGNSDANPEKTLQVEPDSITVADGGTLNIRGRYTETADPSYIAPSKYANVKSNIYVQGGGTLNLKKGAWLAGSVHAAGTDTKKAEVNIIGNDVCFDTANGGSINIWANAKGYIGTSTTFSGNIAVDTDGEILIDGSSTNPPIIIGDIYCLGKLTINGNITLKALAANLIDDPATPDVNESEPRYHGIFIYDFPGTGTGSLDIKGTDTEIKGDAFTGTENPNPRLHTFVSYPSITGAKANKIFCADRDESNNICKHWTMGVRVWQKQSMTGG